MLHKIKKAVGALKKINSLEKKLNLINNELRLLLPEIIPLNEEMQNEIKRFEQSQNISGKLNYAISKNDLMFRYSCYHHNTISEGFYGYLLTGLNGKNIVQKVIDAHFENSQKVNKILDFASGYGRVTRFLCAEYSAEKIWASEIKPKALDFIHRQFLCSTIQSGFVPEDFNAGHQFEVIYVGSLFSHLPEDLFKRWLKTLYSLLSETGILILSTHDISLINKNDKNAFVFIEDSEDQMFKEVDDHIKDAAKYGAAYLGKNRMNKILEQVGVKKEQYVRFKRVLSNVQDVYVIGKNKIKLAYKPDLTSFP